VSFLSAARKAIWGLLLMLIILGGIYTGMFTPTEAAAVAAVYSAFIALFVYKDLTFRETPKVLLDAAKLSIMLMFIIANAMLFAHVLTTEQLPQQITAWVIEAGLTPVTFLLVVNIVLLVAGAFMEPSAIILILAPILFPIAIKLGIDPIHLGIIMVVNLEIGLITPPVRSELVRDVRGDRHVSACHHQGSHALAGAVAAVPGADYLCTLDCTGTAQLAGHELMPALPNQASSARSLKGNRYDRYEPHR
jgi:tripartite ATP-independent transporter DctM subunit